MPYYFFEERQEREQKLKQIKENNNILFEKLYENPLTFFKEHKLSDIKNIEFIYSSRNNNKDFYYELFDDFIWGTDNFILFKLLMSGNIVTDDIDTDDIDTDEIDTDLDFINPIVEKIKELYTFRLLIFSNIEYLKKTYDYVDWDSASQYTPNPFIFTRK